MSEDTFSHYCIHNKKNILLGDIEKECNQYLSDYSGYIKKIREHQKIAVGNIPQSSLFIPLILKDKVVGTMSIQSYQKNAYTPKDLNTLQILAAYIAIALENTQLFKEVEYRAAYDELTGIYNRREIIKRGVEQYEKNKENTCLIMLDIDDFKRVNDTYGHMMGDKLLREVAQAIKTAVRTDDLVGRYGGEEFLVILPKTEIKQAALIGEQIRKYVEEIALYDSTQGKIQTSISLGIIGGQGEKDSFENMLRGADKALYSSKAKGKNQVTIY